MSAKKPLTRWNAAGLHLCISLFIGVTIFAIIFFVWYPPPLFSAMGGKELQITVLAVDVVLGPVLTLAVYRAGKRGMRFDIAVIAVLQFSALAYGVYVVALARPVFLVARSNIAYVVSASELSTASLEEAAPDYRTLSLTGPVRVSIADARSKEEKQQRLDLTLNTGLDVHQFPRYYSSWDTVARQLPANAESAADLMKRKPEFHDRVQEWLTAHGRKPGEVGLISLMTFHAEISMLIDLADGTFLGMIDVDPS